MKKPIEISAIKANIVFKAGNLPDIDPNNPEFTLMMGPLLIRSKISGKSARKLAAHGGGAVLQGRLIIEGGKPTLVDAGFTWIDPKPVEVVADEVPAVQ